MATKHYCDYCGGLIDGKRAGVWFAPITLSQPLTQREVSDRKYLYHSEPPGFDEESCLDKAGRVLKDMATWAHHGEGSELTWLLVKRPQIGGAKCVLGDEEWKRRYVESDLPDLTYSQQRSLIQAGLWQLEQIALTDEETLLSLNGVGPKAVAVLRRALAQRGLELGQTDSGCGPAEHLPDTGKVVPLRRGDAA